MRATKIVLLLAQMRLFRRKLLACSPDSKPSIALPMTNWEMVRITPLMGYILQVLDVNESNNLEGKRAFLLCQSY